MLHANVVVAMYFAFFTLYTQGCSKNSSGPDQFKECRALVFITWHSLCVQTLLHIFS